MPFDSPQDVDEQVQKLFRSVHYAPRYSISKFPPSGNAASFWRAKQKNSPHLNVYRPIWMKFDTEQANESVYDCVKFQTRSSNGFNVFTFDIRLAVAGVSAEDKLSIPVSESSVGGLGGWAAPPAPPTPIPRPPTAPWWSRSTLFSEESSESAAMGVALRWPRPPTEGGVSSDGLVDGEMCACCCCCCCCCCWCWADFSRVWNADFPADFDDPATLPCPAPVRSVPAGVESDDGLLPPQLVVDAAFLPVEVPLLELSCCKQSVL